MNIFKNTICIARLIAIEKYNYIIWIFIYILRKRAINNNCTIIVIICEQNDQIFDGEKS